MTTALEGVGESASRPGRFLPPRKNWYQLYRRLGGPQGRSGQVRKILPPPGFDPRTVQPVSSHYTDWATRPTESDKIIYNFRMKWVRKKTWPNARSGDLSVSLKDKHRAVWTLITLFLGYPVTLFDDCQTESDVVYVASIGKEWMSCWKGWKLFGNMSWCKKRHSFDLHGSAHRRRIFKHNQQDARLNSIFISVKSSTCFRRFLHPSSGAKTLYIASGTLSNIYCYLPLSLLRLWQVSVNVWQSTRCFIYSFELLMMDGGTAWNM